jgi:hypothetical protein
MWAGDGFHVKRNFCRTPTRAGATGVRTMDIPGVAPSSPRAPGRARRHGRQPPPSGHRLDKWEAERELWDQERA